MNDKENGSRYPPKAYGLNNQQDYYSSLRFKVSDFNVLYGRASNQYPDEEGEGIEEEEIREEDEKINGVRMIGKDTDDDDDDDDVGEEDYVSDEDDDDVDNDNRDDGKEEGVDNGRIGKKRKLRTLISDYEFAPRVPTPLVQKAVLSPSQPLSGGQNSVGEWTEQETFALLDVWGDLFVRRGRRSLRAEEWQIVAEKVSQQTNIDRTDVQCRNRLDTLKKKYKKEKAKVMSGESKWIFFRKIDMLLCSPAKQQNGLSCGIDSGEYVFTNPDVYMNWANGLDEMRDSPENSESSRDRENILDGLPSKRKRDAASKADNSSFRLLAESMEKFSNMYEKIENSKTKQIAELETTRMEFQKQVEAQMKQILEKAQVEITKIRQGHDYENDLSPENLSG